jgi:hypothetical protein
MFQRLPIKPCVTAPVIAGLNGIEFLLGTNPTKSNASTVRELVPVRASNTSASVASDIPVSPASDAQSHSAFVSLGDWSATFDHGGDRADNRGGKTNRHAHRFSIKRANPL